MYDRFAIFVTPQGPFAEVGAAWLGWDIATGQPVAHPKIAGLDLPWLTRRPRRYGFHGTIKPPFRLRTGQSESALIEEFSALCENLSPVSLAALQVTQMGGFLALRPGADVPGLSDLAGQVVRELDSFRASPTEAELARRRSRPLTQRQEQYLEAWGYPFVMEEFRFHITLTGWMDAPTAAMPLVTAHFSEVLASVLVVRNLTLVGQRSDGMFTEIERVPLGASTGGVPR